MENDLEPQRVEQKIRIFPLQNGDIKNGLALVKPNCFFCSLDLKDAYFSVHVNKSSQEYLKFLWGGQLYMFTAFPNGLACCPRLFTKLLKPVMAHLHILGFVSTIFIDDTMLTGDSGKECVQNVKSSLAFFKSLGCVVHPTKSVLIPSHKTIYLGFEIDLEYDSCTNPREKTENTEYSLQIADRELIYCKGVSAVHTAGRFMFSGSEVRTALVSLHGEQ